MAPATQGTFAKMSLRHCLLLVVVLMLAEYFYRPVSAWTPSEELQPYAYMRALLTPNVGDPGNQCPVSRLACTTTHICQCIQYVQDSQAAVCSCAGQQTVIFLCGTANHNESASQRSAMVHACSMAWPV